MTFALNSSIKSTRCNFDCSSFLQYLINFVLYQNLIKTYNITNDVLNLSVTTTTCGPCLMLNSTNAIYFLIFQNIEGLIQHSVKP